MSAMLRYLVPAALASLLLARPTLPVTCTLELAYSETGNGPSLEPDDCDFFCRAPVAPEPIFENLTPGCTADSGWACTIKATIPNISFPGNHQNPFNSAYSFAHLELINLSTGLSHGRCGAAGSTIVQSLGIAETTQAVDCNDRETLNFRLDLFSCAGLDCEKITSLPLDFGAFLGCPVPPPPDACPIGPSSAGAVLSEGRGAGGGTCRRCRSTGGGCSISVGDGQPSCQQGDSGPGAFVRFRSGGVGGSGLPGAAAWREQLGLYWSHDYAARIVVSEDALSDPDNPHHVWLLASDGAFVEFLNLGATNATTGLRTYQENRPSDEYRTLTFRPADHTWRLDDLDGRLHYFRADGKWRATVLPQDPNHPIEGTYTGPLLTSVALPDGRTESLTYYEAGSPSAGKLQTIAENPVGGGPGRTWTYYWVGDELRTIVRPDGLSWEYTYDPLNAGRLLRVRLVGTDGVSGRIAQGFEYDAVGRVSKSWRGDPAFAGPLSVDRLDLVYKGGALPAKTTILDWVLNDGGGGTPLKQETIFLVERDAQSPKARIRRVEGECPSCGGTPVTYLFYEDPAHPLLPTSILDARGAWTRLSYTEHGQISQMREADGLPEQRTRTYSYDARFPALATQMTQPSTSGVGERVTSWNFDDRARLLSSTLAGIEGGSPFAYTTSYVSNESGEVSVVNPPGFGESDQSTYLYEKPGRGGHVVTSRVDPLVGATLFDYDGFNRQLSVTDPNGLVTLTEYDSLSRVLQTTQVGAAPPADNLVAQHLYDCPPGATGCGPFLDLRCTRLPEGNASRYGYDTAGRLVFAERAASCDPAVQAIERTEWTLNFAGSRTLERQLRSNGSGGWIEDSRTAWDWRSKCHAEKVTQGSGTTISTTEFCYDKNKNLEAVWDANHARASQPTLPSTRYVYDGLNRLVETRQPWAVDDVDYFPTDAGPVNGEAVTRYHYDAQDHVDQVTDAESNVTTYLTSDRDLVTLQTSQVSGATTYSYNEHGALVGTTDARGVSIARSVDALDRVTVENFADDKLDTIYVYDTSAPGEFFKGRLKSIARGGETVLYAYDRFGRMTQDGVLGHFYDRNARRTTTTYPGGLSSTVAYDAADRPVTLVASGAGLPGTASIVAGAAYLAGGAPTQLLLGNGLSEQHFFDSRGFPDRIKAGTLLDWDYTTDKVGNVNLTGGPNTGFYYRDYQYYLARAFGPFPNTETLWKYDKTGNRTNQESHFWDGPPFLTVVDQFTFVPNSAGGKSPLIDEASRPSPSPLPVQQSQVPYEFDAVGNQSRVFRPDLQQEWRHDDSGRLARFIEATTGEGVTFSYDPRGFLREARQDPTACSPLATTAVYASDGLLQQRTRRDATTATALTADYILYFAGRPVAQVTTTPGPTKITWLTTDHLGTPILATSAAGTTVWSGGFEAFGRDWNGALAANVFLRLPGQWDDPAWASMETGGYLPTGTYYNVNRWYQVGIGRYDRPDPLLILGPTGENAYAYAESRPTRAIDPLGLCSCLSDCPSGEWNYYGGSASWGMAFGGIAGGAGVFTCRGRPSMRVPVKFYCPLVGLGYMIGAGVDGTPPYFSGLPAAPAACGCASNDLLGPQTSYSLSFPGAGSIGLGSCQIPDRVKPYSWQNYSATLGVGPSVGLGAFQQRCKVFRLGGR